MAKKQEWNRRNIAKHKFNTGLQMGPHQEKNFLFKKKKRTQKGHDVHSGWEQEGQAIKGKTERGGQDENVIMPRKFILSMKREADGGLYAGNWQDQIRLAGKIMWVAVQRMNWNVERLGSL